MRRRRAKITLIETPVQVENLSHDGRGIAKVEGKTLFVAGALPGEKVTYRLLKKHSNFDEAEVAEVLESANERMPAHCAAYGRCGGCSQQHLPMDSQLQLKQDALLEKLTHFGKVTPENLMPPLDASHWGYRRKARLGVKYVAKKETVLIGFREKHSNLITDTTECPVLIEAVARLLTPLREVLSDLEARAKIPQIEVAVGDSDVALVFRHLEPLSESDQQRLIEFAQAENIHLYFQPKGPKTVHKVWPEDGEERLYYTLPDFDLRFAFHPLDFTQVNLELNRKMINQALDLLDLKQDEKVLDLFSGLGNFSLPMAKQCREVVAVEFSEEMVERGGENAKANALSNLRFYAKDLSQDFSDAEWAKEDYDKVLLDPPRAGALAVMPYLLEKKPKIIVYVSCDTASFARDAGELVAGGYQLAQLGIMNMFPHTSHTETMGLFVLDEG